MSGTKYKYMFYFCYMKNFFSVYRGEAVVVLCSLLSMALYYFIHPADENKALCFVSLFMGLFIVMAVVLRSPKKFLGLHVMTIVWMVVVIFELTILVLTGFPLGKLWILIIFFLLCGSIAIEKEKAAEQ